MAPAVLNAAGPAVPAAPPAGGERYAGRYRSPWADAQVLVVDPMPVVTWLVPTAEHAFRGETRNGFGSHGEPVVFELGPDGRVARLTVGDNVMMSVTEW